MHHCWHHYDANVVRNSSVSVEYERQVRQIEAGDVATFGRGSDDIDLGDNPLVHRLFGRIFWRSDSWWLHNEGSRLTLSIHDRTSSSTVKLAAGREVSLSFPQSVVRFSAGDTQYEICIDVRDPAIVSESTAPRRSSATDATIDQSKVPLSGDQRLLLVALAADKLRNPYEAIELPTNKSIAHLFGWSGTQFNRKLDRLCKKFTRNGVPGLVGDAGTLANNRRLLLVEHAFESGLITAEDLELLNDYPQ